MVKTIKKISLKRGALSRQLNISLKKDIPVTLLRKIVKAQAGDTIRNPTKTGKKVINVTRLMERRAIFAKSIRKIRM